MRGLTSTHVLALAVVIAVGAGWLIAATLPIIAVSVAAATVGAALPLAVLRWRGRARRKALRQLWPDVLEQLVAVIRSGSTVGDALCALAENGPDALRPAFRIFTTDVERDGRLMPALDALKTRLADPVADQLVETVRVAREVGGSELPAILRSLSSQVRAEAAVRAEAEARRSWVVSAARLGVIAPWVVLLLLGSRPEVAEAYNTPAGVGVLSTGFVLTFIAYRLMIRVGRLPQEGRWFA
ncbi:type II secretion system F family protein [Homoserinibacter sp. GY 40078]|uniref:type II secretion system F family protein n=1 Tax=Homoserinibacter sp. GY 40078 TaxID=2603275 RepID=UPI0016501DAE|nr:type II secretion system F family protein [Homoserinibacter sp. GY 40078]